MENEMTVQDMVERARKAQAAIENYSQHQVDELVRALAKAVYDNAEPLAELAVNETRMGRVDHKIKKNQGKARILWWALKNQKSVGIIDRDNINGIVKVAKPMGVIGAITPTTNPVVTPMCNAMFALKGRNSIIICPHPRSKKTSLRTVELMNEALRELSAPEHLIQCIAEPTIDISKQVMSSTDVCISTGGMGMVKAAYSSGKPAFGVGAGNVQCLIDRNIDLGDAIPKIIEGREFDNGIICSAEQTVICPVEEEKSIVELFQQNGALFIDDPSLVNKVRDTLFASGVMNKDCVGKSAKEIALMCDLEVEDGVRIIILKTDKFGNDDLLSKEKMCPVISLYVYEDWKDAVAIAKANLNVEGKGHTVSIHSANQANIEYASEQLPVSRILVNQICATMNGGSFYNDLAATTTLGCGSWGGNSISENLSYKHLFNVSRIANVKPDVYIPDDAEIWE